MKWITKIEQFPELPMMGADTRFAAFGSCFASHIYDHLKGLKFSGIYNPFGITYDPMSLSRQLAFIQSKAEIDPADTIKKDDYYVHLDFHSDCNRMSTEDLSLHVHEQSADSLELLRGADIAIITLGSSWVFRHLESDRPVANCHGLPGNQFNRELMNYEEITHSLEQIVSTLKSIKSDVKLIFTVSPVRHIRYGVIDNSRSKAMLLSSVHEIVDKYADAYYFPSYEIILDELRDYRFYSEDLVHPSAQAVDYVLDYWGQEVFNKNVIQRNKEIEKIQAALAHRPRQLKSNIYAQHLNRIAQKIEECKNSYPDLDWTPEISKLNKLKEKLNNT